MIATLLMIVIPSAFLLLVDTIVGDIELFIFVNQGIINPILDIVCVYTSPLLFVGFYSLILTKLYLSHKNSCIRTGIVSLATGPLSYGLGSLIKLLVRRPRPFDALPSVRVIGPLETSSFSFPSTTTMLVFGFAIPILMSFEKRHYGGILLVLSYFIGFSVVYTGFHFPFDVVAGILLSLSLAICTNKANALIARFFEKVWVGAFF